MAIMALLGSFGNDGDDDGDSGDGFDSTCEGHGGVTHDACSSRSCAGSSTTINYQQ